MNYLFENSYVTECVAIRFCLCWRHSDDLFVCIGAKPTQRTEDEISREARSGGGTEGPRKVRESSWQSRAEEDGRLEVVVQGKDSQQKEVVRGHREDELAFLMAL